MPDIAINSNKSIGLSQHFGFKILSVCIKVLIALLAIGFIYYEIFYNRDLAAIRVFAPKMFSTTVDYILLFSVLGMMLLNWTVESAKWKFLIRKIEHISLLRALMAIFSGTSISVFTPNRVGDFGARVLYLDHSDRIQGVFITILGSISQLVITILIGLVGMSFFVISQSSEFIDPVLEYLLFGVLALGGILTVVCYYNVSIFTSWGKRIFKLFGISGGQQLQKRLKGYAEVFSLYSPKELSLTLAYSFTRYFVFSLQFYLLLILFGVEIPAFQAFSLIALIFFAMAVIPTVALTELGIRGSVALYFLGLASDNSIGIITATFTLWIINLALPAIIGSIFVFGANIFGLKKKL